MTSALMICKALLERSPVDEQSALLALLPAEERKQLEQLDSATLPEHKKIPDPLNHVHFTWLAPFLRTLAKGDLKLFLAALSTDQADQLKKQLGFTEALPSISQAGKEFLRHFLLKQLTAGQDLIDLPFIPASPLRPLIELSNTQLIDLMQLLGLYDLSTELRQIIDTTQLKKIHAALGVRENQFLKSISSQGDLIVFQRLFLQGWDGKRSSLLSLLQARGLQRLALALYGQNSSLVWAVTHALEHHLATQLLKHAVQSLEKRLQQTLTEQVVTTLGKL